MWGIREGHTQPPKHRVSFDEAATVFYDSLAASFLGPDYSDDENRVVTIGYSARGPLLVVCHDERGAATRLKPHAGQLLERGKGACRGGSSAIA
jgi:uncharacterized protein